MPSLSWPVASAPFSSSSLAASVFSELAAHISGVPNGDASFAAAPCASTARRHSKLPAARHACLLRKVTSKHVSDKSDARTPPPLTCNNTGLHACQ